MKSGDRVRMVQTTSTGTVIDSCVSAVDGTPRVLVRWDGSGQTTGWSPGFLRPANTNPADDPDEVQEGTLVRRRGRMTLGPDGIMVVVHEGFARVPATEPPTPG